MNSSTESLSVSSVAQLTKKQGDAASGEAVFAQACAACHQINDKGIDFGPNLSEIGSKLPKAGLYNAILSPDEGISFGYEGYIINKKDGSQVVGFIASETDVKLDIKMAGGFVQSIDKADISSRTKMENSLMPNLHQALGNEKLVHLVEYLSSLKASKGN